ERPVGPPPLPLRGEARRRGRGRPRVPRSRGSVLALGSVLRVALLHSRLRLPALAAGCTLVARIRLRRGSRAAIGSGLALLCDSGKTDGGLRRTVVRARLPGVRAPAARSSGGACACQTRTRGGPGT